MKTLVIAAVGIAIGFAYGYYFGGKVTDRMKPFNHISLEGEYNALLLNREMRDEKGDIYVISSEVIEVWK